VKGYNTGLKKLVRLTGVQGCEPPFDKLNAKTEPHFSYILIVSTFLVFSKLFFAFFGSFWTVVFRLFQVLVCRHPHPDTVLFLNFFMNVGEEPLRWPVGLFQLHLPPWLKPLATQLVYNLIFLNNFLLGYTKNANSQHG